MNRRELLSSGIAATFAALGIKAAAVELKQVDMDGGSLGRKTTFTDQDPKMVGVFAVEVHPKTSPDQAEIKEALRVLKKFGANIYDPHEYGAFPVYDTVTGGPVAGSIFYFIVPNENGKEW